MTMRSPMQITSSTILRLPITVQYACTDAGIEDLSVVMPSLIQNIRSCSEGSDVVAIWSCSQSIGIDEIAAHIAGFLYLKWGRLRRPGRPGSRGWGWGCRLGGIVEMVIGFRMGGVRGHRWFDFLRQGCTTFGSGTGASSPSDFGALGSGCPLGSDPRIA